jgi:hypothetical protein
MGWNTTALFLHGASPEAAVATLAPAEPTGEWVGPDEATTGLRPDVVYAGVSGDWAQVWNPGCDLVPAWAPAGPAPALTVLFSSVASTYGFALFENGAIRRQYVVADGEAVVDAGEPLPVEAGIEVPAWGPDEDFVWAVVRAVTGAGFDESVRYQAYALR